ncbi:MAG TPA: four-carbon acid sugar kinase family protein, partial [Azospirillum sp.]
MVQDPTAKALIVADDLSGAADGGTVFAAAGLETVMLLDPRGVPGAAVEAVAIDLDSRRLPAAPAAALHAET